jgi:hypothetical protein
LEFWDRPRTNEWWEVYAIVGYDIENPTADFEPPVQLQLEEIVHIVEEAGGQPSIPGVQEDVVGWRRLRVDMGRALCDFPLMPAAVGGSVAWTCTENPRPITFRLVPVQTTTITSLQPNGNLFQFAPEYSTRNSLNHLNRRALFLLEYQRAETEGLDAASHALSNRPESRHAASSIAPSVEPVPTADAIRTKRSLALNLTKTDSASSTEEPWYEELVDVIALDVASAWRDSL